MRRLLTWIVVLGILAGVIYLGSPYYAAYRLVQAARAGDAKTVASFVDFPAVRASLKPQLQTYLQQEIARQQRQPHTIWEKLGLAIAPYFAGPSTDLLITPQNVGAMIRTAQPPHLSNPVAGAKEAKLSDDKGPGDVRPIRLGYVGDDLDQFRAEVVSRSHPGSRVRLGMLRRGFFTWKVVTIDLSALPKAATPPAE